MKFDSGGSKQWTKLIGTSSDDIANDIIIDSSLNRFEHIYGAAGHPDCVFKINYVDLINLTNGLEKEIIE